MWTSIYPLTSFIPRSLPAPMMQIAENAGIDGGIVVEKVRIFKLNFFVFFSTDRIRVLPVLRGPALA